MQPRETWEYPGRVVGRRVLVFERVDSTNNLATAFAAQPDSDGLAVLADEQSAGRGQHGRKWVAPPRSSVLLSVLLFPRVELRRPVLLTAWAAVAVCEVVRKTTGIEPRIKWPNDVYFRGRKVCGILIEQSQQGLTPALVAGIGLNVTQTEEQFAAAGLPLATSLHAGGASNADRDGVARELLARLDVEYDRLCQGDRTTLETCWKRHLGVLGHEVVAECADGSRQGRILEMGFDGIVLDQGQEGIVLLPPETILHIEPV
jgi:BirA family biotin operon repressor/biotin-[acetyl-CoA-carboxylase] ligase